MIKFNHTADGGFVVGDTTTNITVYAYPSSEHATKAKKNPAKVAAEMISAELEIAYLHQGEIGQTYDANNWTLLA